MFKGLIVNLLSSWVIDEPQDTTCPDFLFDLRTVVAFYHKTAAILLVDFEDTAIMYLYYQINNFFNSSVFRYFLQKHCSQ